MSVNLYAVLQAGFPTDPGTTAIDCIRAEDGTTVRRWTYAELDRLSAQMANLLASFGLPAGARVAARVDKSVEALCLYLATVRAGYVYLPLNTAYQRAEIEYFLGDATPSVVVVSDAAREWVEPLAASIGARVLTLDADGSGTLTEDAARQSSEHSPVDVIGEDLAVILYTSGTTGRSKGAMLSHANIAANARVLKRYWGWTARDALIHALPIFHIHGLFVAANGALLAGARMLWFDRFDPARVIQWLPEATLFMGVPTLYTRMLAEPTLDRASCRSMRLFIAGSAPLMPETHAAWRERTGHVILERYGMSETGMLTSNPWQADARYGGQSERRAGTVGFPLPGVELRIRDEQGRACGVDEVGGIEVRGPNVFKGYWRMPEKTREEFTADGFFKTGDLGRIDARGYVSIVGRARDMIISGGYNVYPAEVESFINALPGVAESAVIGVPHPDFGEVGIAVVTPRKGMTVDPEAVLAELKKTVANYKVPKRCFVIDELPRNTMGKVQKNVLRSAYQQLFVSSSTSRTR
ncbi:MAG: malonate--CoA ligase [Casimicrobiaceae bacterium]